MTLHRIMIRRFNISHFVCHIIHILSNVDNQFETWLGLKQVEIMLFFLGLLKKGII